MRANRFDSLNKRIRTTYEIWYQSGDNNTAVYLSAIYHGVIPRGSCTYAVVDGHLVISQLMDEYEETEDD